MQAIDYYKNITKTKEEDILLIEPYSAGDVYQTLSLVDHLREKYKPNKVNLVCLHKGLAAAKLFNNIDNACTFPYLDGEKIQLIANTTWYQKQEGLFICYPSFFNLYTPNGKEYMNKKKELLGIEVNKRPTQPRFNKEIYKKSLISAARQGLTKDSIIIFNHSYTIKPLPAEAYESLAKKFSGKVFYDKWSNGKIHGAVPLDIELEEVPYFAQIAGTVITMRSGILELLCGTSANIYTIYPDSDYCNNWTSNSEKKSFMDFIKSCKISDFDLNPNAKEYPIYIDENESINSIQYKIVEKVLQNF